MESSENQNHISKDHLQDNPIDDNQNQISQDVTTSSPPPRRAKRRWLSPLIATLLVVGGGVAAWRLLSPKSEPPAATANQPKGTTVKLSETEQGTINSSSTYVARLESRRSVNLLPQIQGRVAKILVRVGDEVKAGTPLIQIDPDEQQAAVNSVNAAAQAAGSNIANAKAQLSSLEAERVENQSNVEFNQKEYERYSRLADQGAVPRSQADQYTNRIEAARAQLRAINERIGAQKAAVAQAEKTQQQAQANAKQQQVLLQYYRVNAPFSGTVGYIPVKLGDYVTPSTQLTTVTENRPLEVNISVPIEMGPQLRQGMAVDLLDAQDQKIGSSRVFFIAPNTTNNTQSVLVKSVFDNAKGQLRADQYVRARLILNQRPGVLIPTTAITRLGGETFVYVAEPAPPPPQAPEQQSQQQPQPAQPQLIARQKPVKLGEIQGNNYQVLEGLKPGERLIVSGLLNLKDGAPIVPES